MRLGSNGCSVTGIASVTMLTEPLWSCNVLYMSTSYYRIQTADRDANLLLDAEAQTSQAWNGNDDLTRDGVSVCDSLEELAEYLATDGQGIPYGAGEWVIVEIEGEYLGAGIDRLESLVRPTRIVAVTAMDDEMFDMIGAAFDAAAGL